MKKRVLSIVLSVVLSASMLMPAMAEDTMPLGDDTIEAFIEEAEPVDETDVSEDEAGESTEQVSENEALESTGQVSENEALESTEQASEDEDATLEAANSCGDNATYSYNSSTKTLTISGTGKISDCAFCTYFGEGGNDNQARATIAQEMTRVDIRDGITEIGFGAFATSDDYIYGFDTITIPKSVKVIGSYAFSSQSRLRKCSIVTSSLLEEIGEHAFNDTRVLASFPFSSTTNLTTIGEGAFSGSGLESMTLPSSVENLGEYAFSNCKKLVTADFSNNKKLTGLPQDVLSAEDVTKTVLNKVILGSNMKQIGKSAFWGNAKLSEITGFSQVTTIGTNALKSCKALQLNSSDLSGLESIGESAFSNCQGLTGSVTFGNRLSTISASAFSECSNLGPNVVIPKSATLIGNNAFISCENLSKVTIMNPDITITGNPFSGLSLTLYGYSGNVKTFAQTNSIPFDELMDISFDVNGVEGITIRQKTVIIGKKMGDLPTLPACGEEGYAYGWFTAKSGGQRVTENTVVTAAMTKLYVQKRMDDVALDPNGGTCSTTSCEIKSDGTLESLPTPAREGYVFLGWYDGDVQVTLQTKFTSAKTIVAKWRKKDARISFNPNGGACSVENLQVNSEGKLQSLPTPSRTHYEFLGWYYESTQKIDTSTVFFDDCNVTAKWKQNEFAISFVPNSATYVPTPEVIFTNSAGKIVDLPSMEQTGFRFDGWYFNDVKVTSDTVFTEDSVLTGKWTQTGYKISFDVNGGIMTDMYKTQYTGENGKVEFFPVVVEGDSEEPVTVYRTGYDLVGWFDGKTRVTKDTCFTSDKVLVAKWVGKKYTNTLKFDANGGASAPEDLCAEVEFPNTSKSFAVGSIRPVGYEKDGFWVVFDGWYSESSGGDKLEIVAVGENDHAGNQTRTVYAHWREVEKQINLIAVKQKKQLSKADFATEEPISKYVVSSKKAATVSSKGLLTVKRGGEFTITAYKKVGKRYEAVGIPYAVRGINPGLRKMTMIKYGQRVALNELLSDPSLAPTSWSSAKPSIARIDSENGELVALKSGKVNITAVFGSGKMAAKYKVAITVKLPTLSVTKLKLNAGKSKALKVKNTSQPVTEWKTSNSEVARVSETGVVTAESRGTATISATVDGVDYHCVVTVK